MFNLNECMNEYMPEFISMCSFCLFSSSSIVPNIYTSTYVVVYSLQHVQHL